MLTSLQKGGIILKEKLKIGKFVKEDLFHVCFSRKMFHKGENHILLKSVKMRVIERVILQIGQNTQKQEVPMT